MECLDRVRDRNFVSTEHSYLQLLSSGLETQQTEDRFSTTNESLGKNPYDSSIALFLQVLPSKDRKLGTWEQAG